MHLIESMSFLALLKNGALFPHTGAEVIFLTYFFYAVALTLMMFAISSFINNPNLALTAGILVHLVSFFVPNGILQSDPEKYRQGF